MDIVPTVFPFVNFLLIVAFMWHSIVLSRGMSAKKLQGFELRLDNCFKDKAEQREQIIGLEQKIEVLNAEISRLKTALHKDRLEEEQKHLEELHVMASQNIRQSREQLVHETRAEEIARIRALIAELEAKRQNIEADLDCIGRKLGDD